MAFLGHGKILEYLYNFEMKTILLGLFNKQLRKNVFSTAWLIPNWGFGHSCLSTVRKITCLSNAFLNVFMHKKTYMYLYLSKGQQIFIYVYLKRLCFLLERYFFQKNLAVCILAEMSAYWRSKIEISTKNFLNYEILVNYANN